MRKVLTAVGLVAVSALALGACGGDDDAGDKLAEKAAEELVDGASDGSVDLDIDDGDASIDIGGDDGDVSIDIGGGELPEELADFPLPDDAKITSSYSGSSGDGSGGAIVSAAANGDYEEVAAGIQSGLEDNGFTISGTYNAESNGIGTASFTFEGDGTTGTVSVTEDETSTEGFDLLISIMTSEESAG